MTDAPSTDADADADIEADAAAVPEVASDPADDAQTTEPEHEVGAEDSDAADPTADADVAEPGDEPGEIGAQELDASADPIGSDAVAEVAEENTASTNTPQGAAVEEGTAPASESDAVAEVAEENTASTNAPQGTTVEEGTTPVMTENAAEPRPSAPEEPPTTTAALATRRAAAEAARSEQLVSRRLEELGAAGGRETPDLLTADRLLDPHQQVKPEPEGAWSHFIYTLSGKRINLGDGKRARERKALTGRIAAPLSGGSRFVPVLSRKGGVGKTTITTLIGMALADARDDRVVAVDANPDRGTLADRIARSTTQNVRDLVRVREQIGGYNDLSTLVARDETRLDVLASASDPRVAEAFSDDDYRNVAEVAGRYYSIILTDTGTGIVHSVMSATLDLADQLVIVAGLSVDEARLASETLTWLETNGFEDLARNAIVVMNQTSAGAPVVRLTEVESHFRTRVREVVRLPYDPQIAAGSTITFRDLQPETRQAARELAALVVENLRSSGEVR